MGAGASIARGAFRPGGRGRAGWYSGDRIVGGRAAMGLVPGGEGWPAAGGSPPVFGVRPGEGEYMLPIDLQVA